MRIWDALKLLDDGYKIRRQNAPETTVEISTNDLFSGNSKTLFCYSDTYREYCREDMVISMKRFQDEWEYLSEDDEWIA